MFQSVAVGVVSCYFNSHGVLGIEIDTYSIFGEFLSRGVYSEREIIDFYFVDAVSLYPLGWGYGHDVIPLMSVCFNVSCSVDR